MIWNTPPPTSTLLPQIMHFLSFFAVHQNPLESSQTQNTLNKKLSTKTQRGTCFTLRRFFFQIERLFEQHHTGTFCSS